MEHSVWQTEHRTERSVWQTKRKLVRFEVIWLVPIVRKPNKTGSKTSFQKPNVRNPNNPNEKWFSFGTCRKTKPFDNQMIMETSEIGTFRFRTFTVV